MTSVPKRAASFSRSARQYPAARVQDCASPSPSSASSGAKVAVFSRADVGKRVSIRGTEVYVEGQFRCVEWGNCRRRDVDDLVISDVQPKPKGLVVLEDRSTFQNPLPGLEQFTPGGDGLRSKSAALRNSILLLVFSARWPCLPLACHILLLQPLPSCRLAHKVGRSFDSHSITVMSRGF